MSQQGHDSFPASLVHLCHTPLKLIIMTVLNGLGFERPFHAIKPFCLLLSCFAREPVFQMEVLI